MPNAPEPPETNDEEDEEDRLLQQLEGYSQLVAELSKRLTETAMARVSRWRRLDLRAVRSMELKPGKYQIINSTPEDPQLRVTLQWMPGQLVLGPDLIETNRDVVLSLPTVRETLHWDIPQPPPNTIPPPLAPKASDLISTGEREERRQLSVVRSQAWKKHHLAQTRAATQQMTADEMQASQDEESMVEAMIEEIELRRAYPKLHLRKTIMDVGQEIASRILEARQGLRD